MTWTTSDNLREFFGARDLTAPPKSHAVRSSARRHGPRLFRHAAVLGLVIAHLMLLGELTVTPEPTAQKLAAVAATYGLTLSWLTITGMMLAILLLARDWPSADGATPTDASPSSANAQPTTFAPPARTLSAQHRADPMTGLLARVSHDLRTPLNAVMGFSDLMQQEAFGPLGDARYQSYARHIHASSAELLKATEDTLAMTALVANPLVDSSEIADLSELISDAFTLALIGVPTDPARGANAAYPLTLSLAPVTLALTVAPQLQVKCERRALRQALINLVSAAIRKVGSTEGHARTIHVKAVTNADVVCLTISVALGRSAPVAAGVADGWNSAEDLPICLARAMLDLQGLSLTLSATPSLWSAQVLLDGVSQSDFFRV